jgi:hypothetical protein
MTLYIHDKGLGLTDNINNTINNNNFIQLDLSNLAQYIKPKTIPNISIVSMFSQEEFKIYGTNILDGILGTLIYESDSNNIIQNIPIPLFGVYKYIQITSDNSDILLESMDFIYNLDVNNKICANTCLCEPYCTCEPICKCGTNKYIEDIKLQDPILTDNNIIENNDIIDNTKQDNNKQDNNKQDNTKQDNNKQDNNKQDNTKQDNNKQNNTKQKNNIKENNIII